MLDRLKKLLEQGVRSVNTVSNNYNPLDSDFRRNVMPQVKQEIIQKVANPIKEHVIQPMADAGINKYLPESIAEVPKNVLGTVGREWNQHITKPVDNSLDRAGDFIQSNKSVALPEIKYKKKFIQNPGGNLARGVGNIGIGLVNSVVGQGIVNPVMDMGRGISDAITGQDELNYNNAKS